MKNIQKTILVTIVSVVVILGVIVVLFLSQLKNESPNIDEPESYISCGCGCCGSDDSLEELAIEECLYKSKGESIQDKIDQDKKLFQRIVQLSDVVYLSSINTVFR